MECVIKTVHLRAPLHQVLAVIDHTLAEEGYIRSEMTLAPRVVEWPTGEKIELPPELPDGMRRVVVAEKDGWVAIADGGLTGTLFATTDWGAKLSTSITTPVVVLAGECDHAFFSTVHLHRGGEVVGESSVPEDAVNESDGRHRIRPLFLVDDFPTAKAQLEAGIVVNRLGGEENVHVVAETLGIPNALMDASSETAEGWTHHLYAFDADRAPPPEDRMRAKLEMLMGGQLAALGIDAGELMAGIASAGLMKVTRDDDRPLSLEAPGSSRMVGFIGQPQRMHTQLTLEGGKDGERAKDLRVELRGDGAALVEVTAIYAGHERTPLSEITLERGGDVVVYVEFVPRGEGKGPLHLHATMTPNLELTNENFITIKPALRIPVFPIINKDDISALEEYGARDVASGWVGFDRPWSEVGNAIVGICTSIAQELLAIHAAEPRPERVVLERDAKTSDIEAALDAGAEVLVPGFGQGLMRVTREEECLNFSALEESPGENLGFRATVLRKGGESLEFPAPAAWPKLVAELERGADVTLQLGPWRRPITLDISHQPEGSNYFPDPERAADYVRVQVAWSFPRPTLEASQIKLGALGTEVLERAGAIEGHLGGVVFASGRALSRSSSETNCERLRDERDVSPARLRAHVRGPGHRVLVPVDAMTKLGAMEGIDRLAVAHGVVLASRARDPFAYDVADAEVMERAVTPML